MRLAVALAAVLITAGAAAQGWPTTEWDALSEDGQTPLEGAREAHAEAFVDMLEEASAWFASMRFRAPVGMKRSPTNPGAYLALLKEDPADIGSKTDYGRTPQPWTRIKLTGDLSMTAPPETITPASAQRWARLMWGSPVHELLHASMWAYPAFEAVAYAELDAGVRLPRCPSSTDATPIGWFNEGASSVLQIRWAERERDSPYGHPFTHPGVAAWVRHFDQPIHAGHVPAGLDDTESPAYLAHRDAGRSWRCGYGTWPFWYFVGDRLKEEPGQEVEYLRYILEQPDGWADGALKAVDRGLRDAAEAFGSSSRVDEGLYELYPAFIAEYADVPAFYERPDSLHLRGGSEVQWKDGRLEALASVAYRVSINVRDDIPRDRPSRFRVTLDPHPLRDQLHLIEGRTVHPRPVAASDPYQVEVPVYRDTTFFVRLANVAEDAGTTGPLDYALRFELGGFYGTPVGGPSEAPEVDTPPGFVVLSGPPALEGCTGMAAGGSVFDLVTAEEAVGDIRRQFEENIAGMEDTAEAAEDGDLPIPGATPEQRSVVDRTRAYRDSVMAEAMARVRARTQAAAEGSRDRLQDDRQSAGAAAIERVEREYRGRSRLVTTLVGEVNGEPCQILIVANLQGEEGGAQEVGKADREGVPDDAPLAVGIVEVRYFAGDVGSGVTRRGGELVVRQSDGYEVCMMTPEEQAEEPRRPARTPNGCPVVCSAGALTLEEARQNHAKGALRADVIRIVPGEWYTDAERRGCPVVDRRELAVLFNVTSANGGPDADRLRGYSDEMLGLDGMSPEGREMYRRLRDGRLFRR